MSAVATASQDAALPEDNRNGELNIPPFLDRRAVTDVVVVASGDDGRDE